LETQWPSRATEGVSNSSAGSLQNLTDQRIFGRTIGSLEGTALEVSSYVVSLPQRSWADPRYNTSSHPAGTARTCTNPINLTWHTLNTTHSTAPVLPLILSEYQELCSNHSFSLPDGLLERPSRESWYGQMGIPLVSGLMRISPTGKFP
jgi:hypothetical protein